MPLTNWLKRPSKWLSDLLSKVSTRTQLASSASPASTTWPQFETMSAGTSTMENKLRPLLDFIGHLESNGNYNAVFGNANATEDLGRLTLDEIHDRQLRHGKITGSSAFGKYQIIRKTLLGLREGLGLSRYEKFQPELQDSLATALIEQRGLHRWRTSERYDDDWFMNQLSKEWASLPYITGRSYYDGDSMGNHARATRDEFRAILQKVKA